MGLFTRLSSWTIQHAVDPARSASRATETVGQLLGRADGPIYQTECVDNPARRRLCDLLTIWDLAMPANDG